MRRICLLLPVVAIIACSPRPRRSTLSSPRSRAAGYAKHAVDDAFVLLMAQGDEDGVVRNGQTVSVRREPFSWVFVSNVLDGFLVNICESRTALDALLSGKHCDEIDGLGGGCGIAEGEGNPEKKAYVAEGSSNYWYFKTQQHSRFNTHEQADSVHVMTRSVENLVNHRTRSMLPVHAYRADTLYVCVVTKRFDTLTEAWDEHQRLGFVLAFADAFGVSGEVVELPEISAPPIGKLDDRAHAGDDSTGLDSAMGLAITSPPDEGDCFVLIGMRSANDTVYKRTVCWDEFEETDEGYKGWFRPIDRSLLHTLQVLLPDGSTEHIFERKKLPTSE
jgi:hypothetical protein